MFRRTTNSSPDDILSALADCGIRARAGTTAVELVNAAGQQWFSEQPYLSVIVTLGSEREQAPYDRFCDNVWHFDTECIEDHGDYVTIAQRLRDLACGDLPIAGIRDHVDIEAGVAWLDFMIGSEKTRWDAEVNDDWVDATILSRFASLLSHSKTGRRFTYLDLGGQDCVIGCSTPQQLKVLNRATGLRFQWLT